MKRFLLFMTQDSKARFITAMVLATFFWVIFFYLPPIYFSATLTVILGFILFFEWKNIFHYKSLEFWMILPLYPTLPFITLIYLNETIYHPLLYYLFLIVFSFDSGSYITGTLFGKLKILPHVSPGKTIEGALGGYVSAVACTLFTFFQENRTVPLTLSLPFVFIVCLIALFGDLFESWLKRQANIKDSGTILPGHGGFLDRFDAVMIVALFFFLFKEQLFTLLIA